MRTLSGVRLSAFGARTVVFYEPELVTREECAEDGRGLMIRLTDAGRKAIRAAAPEHAENVQRYFFDLVSREELETLGAVFDRLLEKLTREEA